MKSGGRVKKIAIGALVLVAALIATLLAVLMLAFPRVRPAAALTAAASPAALARGDYLVNHVLGCIPCHSPVDESLPGDVFVPGRRGAGRDFGTGAGLPGRIRSHNLTADPETGLGRWSDGEVVRAIREGIGKDGRALFPQMPYKTFAATLSDDDTLAVVAYLRTLPAIANDPGRSEVDFPLSLIMRTIPAPVVAPVLPLPADADPRRRGEWLLSAGLCHECHDTFDSKHRVIPGMALAGGFEFKRPNGPSVFASNLTSDPATGIGAYSDADLRRALEEGIGKDGRVLYVMPWPYFKGLSDSDKQALIVALRATPPVSHLATRAAR